MGNEVSFEFDEFYMKFAFHHDKEAPSNIRNSKYIKWTHIQINSLNFILGRLLLTDMQENLVKDEEEMKELKDFVENEILEKNSNECIINVTGYGFEVYREEILKFFSLLIKKYDIHKEKNIKCIAKAILYCKNKVNKDLFYSMEPISITNLKDLKEDDIKPEKKIYKSFKHYDKPFMVVNIKSGVSYYKLEEDGSLQRLSGSIIGESTFAGLIRLLAGYENCEDALGACTKGDNTKVDMTVKDIYGGSCLSLGLSEDILASSMGRAQYVKDKSELKPEDISRSVLIMMCMNVSQLANLVAEAEGLETVVVQGFAHLGFQKLFQSFFSFWSRNQRQLLFTDLGEFLGNIGLLLMKKEEAEQF